MASPKANTGLAKSCYSIYEGKQTIPLFEAHVIQELKRLNRADADRAAPRYCLRFFDGWLYETELLSNI